MDNLVTEIKTFIVDNFLFGLDSDEIKNDTSLIAQGIIDSSGIMELVSFLEANYALKVADSELLPSNLDSVQCITRYVRRKLKVSADWSA